MHHLEHIFCHSPQKPALRWGSTVMTYGQLYEEAQQLAEFLKTGSGPLLVYGHKHPRMIVALLACLLSKRPWMPCDLSMPMARIEAAAAICGANQLFLAEGIALPKEIEGLTSFSWEDVPPKTQNQPFSFQPDTVAYIMFTSGTTGQPKAIPITLGNLENFAQWLLSYDQLASAASDCVINQANLSFDLSVADWCAALCTGGVLRLTTNEEQQKLAPFFAHIAEAEGCFLACTPTFLRLCACDSSFCSRCLPGLRAIFLCGEPLLRTTAQLVMKRFPQTVLFHAYGPTEATCAVCGLPLLPQHLEQEPLPVGQLSSAAVNITLRDGEIILDGPSVFGGYLGQEPPASAAYATGDLGRIENGLLYCLGRRDKQIKYMGYRIDLNEIRLALEALPQVQQAAVIAQRDSHGVVRRLAAYLSPFPAETDDLRRALSEQLPAYMIPQLFFPLEQLPVSANLKTQGG